VKNSGCIVTHVIVKRKNFWQNGRKRGPVGVIKSVFVTGWVPGT